MASIITMGKYWEVVYVLLAVVVLPGAFTLLACKLSSLNISEVYLQVTEDKRS